MCGMPWGGPAAADPLPVAGLALPQLPLELGDLAGLDHVRIEFTNHLPEPATMHWHGLVIPNRMDGPGYITQDPVPPGGSYRPSLPASAGICLAWCPWRRSRPRYPEPSPAPASESPSSRG